MSLAVFSFNEHNVRLYQIEGTLAIPQTDLAKALKIRTSVIKMQVDRNPERFRKGREYDVFTIRDSIGRMQKQVVWTERGIYVLLMRLNLPIALEFQDRLVDFLADMREGKFTVNLKMEATLLAQQMNLNRKLLSEEYGLEQDQSLHEKVELVLEEQRQLGKDIRQLIESWKKDTKPLLEGSL